jgi:hypothetical protein
MDYPNEPHDNSYPLWIVGGIVGMVLIVGAFVVYENLNTDTRSEKVSPPQNSTASPATSPTPSTTGSGVRR